MCTMSCSFQQQTNECYRHLNVFKRVCVLYSTIHIYFSVPYLQTLFILVPQELFIFICAILGWESILCLFTQPETVNLQFQYNWNQLNEFQPIFFQFHCFCYPWRSAPLDILVMSYETNEEHCTYAIFSNKYVMLKLFMKVRLTLSTFMQNIQNLKKCRLR